MYIYIYIDIYNIHIYTDIYIYAINVISYIHIYMYIYYREREKDKLRTGGGRAAGIKFCFWGDHWHPRTPLATYPKKDLSTTQNHFRMILSRPQTSQPLEGKYLPSDLLSFSDQVTLKTSAVLQWLSISLDPFFLHF